MSRRPGPLHIVAALLAAAAYAAMHSVIVWPMFLDRGYDYAVHVDMGEALYHLRVSEPHFLYHLLIAILYAIHLAPSFLAAARWILVAASAAAALLVYGGIWWAVRDDRRWGSSPVVFFATLAVMLAQPIGRFDWYEIGYLWNEPFMIPTYTLLAPFALAGFFLTVAYLFSKREAGWSMSILFFAVTAGGALAKPSFLICLLPAAMLLAAWRLWRGLPVARRTLLAGLVLPALLVLGGQFLLTYGAIRGVVGYQDSLVWAPLRVMSHWASGLGIKFLLSTLFPLAVLLVNGRAALRDGQMQLAWLTFGAGSAYAYLLSERVRATDGNFLWSAYITLFILFVASVIFMLRQATIVSWRRTALCLCALAPHVISGVLLDRKYLGWAMDRMR